MKRSEGRSKRKNFQLLAPAVWECWWQLAFACGRKCCYSDVVQCDTDSDLVVDIQ